MRLRSVAIGTALTLMLVGFEALPANATGSRSSTPTRLSLSAPGPGATLAQWQAYAAQQRATVQSVNWLTAVSSPGCTVTSATVAPIDGTAPGVPVGVVTDGVVIEGQCGVASLELPDYKLR